MLRVGSEDLAIFRVNGPGDDGVTAASHPHGHHHRFRSSCRPVVHAGVGHVHAGELGDHGLKLKDGLERALSDLGLVGRITRQKFAALNERIDDDGAVMAISACAEKAGVISCVLLPGGAEVFDDLALCLLPRHGEVAFKAVLGGNAREEIVDRLRADLGQHLPAFFVGFGKVAHFLSF